MMKKLLKHPDQKTYYVACLILLYHIVFLLFDISCLDKIRKYLCNTSRNIYNGKQLNRPMLKKKLRNVILWGKVELCPSV